MISFTKKRGRFRNQKVLERAHTIGWLRLVKVNLGLPLKSKVWFGCRTPQAKKSMAVAVAVTPSLAVQPLRVCQEHTHVFSTTTILVHV